MSLIWRFCWIQFLYLQKQSTSQHAIMFTSSSIICCLYFWIFRTGDFVNFIYNKLSLGVEQRLNNMLATNAAPRNSSNETNPSSPPKRNIRKRGLHFAGWRNLGRKLFIQFKISSDPWHCVIFFFMKFCFLLKVFIFFIVFDNFDADDAEKLPTEKPNKTTNVKENEKKYLFLKYVLEEQLTFFRNCKKFSIILNKNQISREFYPFQQNTLKCNFRKLETYFF